jgi:hypothetical protein
MSEPNSADIKISYDKQILRQEKNDEIELAKQSLFEIINKYAQSRGTLASNNMFRLSYFEKDS